jgi:hypothetical protein
MNFNIHLEKISVVHSDRSNHVYLNFDFVFLRDFFVNRAHV